MCFIVTTSHTATFIIISVTVAAVATIALGDAGIGVVYAASLSVTVSAAMVASADFAAKAANDVNVATTVSAALLHLWISTTSITTTATIAVTAPSTIFATVATYNSSRYLSCCCFYFCCLN